jgi:putative membrane protein
MRIIALLLVAIVALSHLGFLVLEMFFWTDPVGYRIFETTPEFA